MIKINNNKIKILNQKKIKRKTKKRMKEVLLVKREEKMALSFQLGFQEKLPMSKATKIRTKMKMPAKMILFQTSHPHISC